MRARRRWGGCAVSLSLTVASIAAGLTGVEGTPPASQPVIWCGAPTSFAGCAPSGDAMMRRPASPYMVAGVSIEQFDRTQWAIDLFRRADLWLPPVTIRAFPTMEACSGRSGSAPIGVGLAEIRLCLSAAEPTFEWILLHELAHVWSRTASARTRHATFLAVRSLASWREGAWHERGAEHAAEVIVWGLMDRPVVPRHIDNTSCQELLVAYRSLTGNSPLHGFNQRCD